jgi:hypothetical protein
VNSAIQRQLRRFNSQLDVLRVGEADAPPKGTLVQTQKRWSNHSHLPYSSHQQEIFD